MLGPGGVTWIDTSVAAVTVSMAAGEVMPFRLALMCVAPIPVAVAEPAEPAALVTVATAAFEESQLTCEVRSCVERSEKRPVALNWVLLPFATLRVGGVTSMVINVAGVTARVVCPVTEPALADIVVDPAAGPVATPSLTVAACA